jgi:glycine cleavage system regulatory protein
MATPLVMTFIGRDRPGLVNAISRKVAENDGTWLESRLAHLAGQFAGIIRVEAPDTRIADLSDALRELEAHGLRVTVERGAAALDLPAGANVNIELLCLDRPGIVRDVTETLTQLGVNIEEFEARLRIPDGLSVEELRKALERLASEMMADITVSGDQGPGA